MADRPVNANVQGGCLTTSGSHGCIFTREALSTCGAQKQIPIDESRTWLGKAIEAGGDAIKQKALDDPDMAPLRKSIGGI